LRSSAFQPAALAVHHHQVLRAAAQNLAREFLVVLNVLLALATLDAIERRLRHEHIAALDQLLHVPEEKREQQRANVRTVHVGVGHDDDLVVAQPGRVEIVLADAGADGRDHRTDLIVAQHLVVAGLFDVEDFALQRQDGLIAAVAACPRGAAGRLTLDEKQLAAFRIFLLTVAELAGQTAGIESALAASQVASFAGGFTGAGGVNGLAHDALHHRLVLVKVLAQLLVQELRDIAADVAVQLALGLPLELRLRQLHAHHRCEALAHVVAAQVFLLILEQPGALAVFVDGACQRGTEAAQVRASVNGVDVVGEAEQVLRV